MAEASWRPPVCDGPALLEREIRLEPVLTSAGAARRFLRETLQLAGRPEWTDAGELAVSELVTNAALHAHTDIEVRLEVFDDRACVGIRDFDPALPVQRNYDNEATTGRGMGLVATISLDCGIHSLGDRGKIAWFCVGPPEEPTVEDLLDLWDFDGDFGDGAGAPAVALPGDHEVVLRSMPVTLWLAARQHHDAVLRELVIYLAARPSIDMADDLAAADHARTCISAAVAAVAAEAERTGSARPVLPAGHPSTLPPAPPDVDLVVSVPDGSSASFAVLQDVLDLAESLAERGALFVRPALPEIVAVRDWVCEQVIAQLSGTTAAPWGGTAQRHFETELPRQADAALEWDDTVVSEAPTGAIAADDANRIVAVSRPIADLLGWRVDDLVGRRVVTVIPPTLREAHVAGFTRHLSTGEAHALDVPLVLPVLRADGTEVRCNFLVERAPDNVGRAVYIAWIDPLP